MKRIAIAVWMSFGIMAEEKTRLQLGSPVPNAGDGRIAMVYLPNIADAAACRAEMTKLADMQKAAREVGVTVTAVVPLEEAKWRTACTGAPSDVRIVFNPGASAMQQLTAFVEAGRVRRILKSDPAATVADVKAWEDGKAIYDAQCARCHGPDGSDMNYPEIKPLTGIGNRIDGAEIIRRTFLTGAVDLSSLSAARLRALGIYVAGL